MFLNYFYIFMGSFSFLMNRNHMLMMLLDLEFIILSLLFSMFLYFLNLSNEYIFQYFLSFSVCEKVLGLSVLVFLIRFHSSDYFYLLKLMW